jgi:hypothetical protein
MSSSASEWIVVVLFFAGFIAFTVAETAWLKKRANIPTRIATAFSVITNFLCITFGFFISFAIFAIILAMAWDGSLQDVRSGDGGIWTAVTVAFLIPFVLLFVTKRLLLKLFQMKTVKNAWGYAVSSSLVFFLCVLALPSLFTFLFTRYI